MITKIKIDGFKTYNNFELEFAPFTVIAGTNASGKSNLFDALSLLSVLAEVDLKTAFSQQRGNAEELFTKFNEDLFADKISFDVEMLVNKTIKDNWGGVAELKYTRLKYELIIKRAINSKGIEDLFIEKEALHNLKHQEDEWVVNHIPTKVRELWRPKVPVGKRGIPYIYTEIRNNMPTVVVPQDGRIGNKREFPIQNIGQTILSGFNSIDFPHVLAAKEEMRSWKFLQLNPDQLRKPSPYLAKDTISANGGNMAATLQRLKLTDQYLLKDISRTLNRLLPNFIEVDVMDDKANKQYIIKLKSEDGREFTSRVLSEGTLRILALCILQNDDSHNGLICFEEPENGIHPARIKDIVALLKGLSVNFLETTTQLRQILVNTHSPILVNDAWVAGNQDKSVKLSLSKLITKIVNVNTTRHKVSITKIFPVELCVTNELLFSDQERRMTTMDVIDYLKTADSEKMKKEILTINE